MRIVRAAADLRAATLPWRKSGLAHAFVPTMGALHAGHMALVRSARAQCDRVVASVFVNPKQFGPNEDFDRYPRTEDHDAALLAEAGCDLMFAPAVNDIYPPGFATEVRVGGLGSLWEGAHRPGHFDGVATVVARLLGLAQAEAALFGEKDWQQLVIIRRMAADLALSTAILAVPTVREPDGLALSSRNRYLSAAERETAPMLYAELVRTAEAIKQGSTGRAACADAVAALTAAGFRVDYVALTHPETLALIKHAPGRLLAAAGLGSTRLIDNLDVG
ncbi:MAG: pantoate--beta-alanine ligase [Sphingomonadaceae bacterium]|nr:pantoate--beta-alanine ligase [Sphingomonadaceae bacterium]